MYEFITEQNRTLRLDLDGRGVIFHYATGKDQKGKILRVGQSWAGIHALLAKLWTRQKYSAQDNSLSVWMQDQELCLRMRALDMKVEECKFSPEETARLMDFLGKAPNLN